MTKGVSADLLLAEIEDILRQAPERERLLQNQEEFIPWLGRASAAIHRWSVPHTGYSDVALSNIQSLDSSSQQITGYLTLMRLLHEARADLRLEVGPQSVIVPAGQTFDYFDQVRQLIEPASQEIWFIDPYLDGDFAGRYLPYVRDGVRIRLLTSGKPSAVRYFQTLLPAVTAYTQQYPARPIEVRSSDSLHDRLLFVDKTTCQLSGASFKDGAKNAPAFLLQILDAFDSVWRNYDALWQSAKVEP